MGFSLVFVGFEIKTHTVPPANMNENHPPFKKKASTRLPIASMFSGHFSEFWWAGGICIFFFSKITQSLKLQISQRFHKSIRIFHYVTRPCWDFDHPPNLQTSTLPTTPHLRRPRCRQNLLVCQQKLRVETWKSTHWCRVYGWFVFMVWLVAGCWVVVVYDVPCDFCSGGVYVVNQFGG